jgi:glycosyltransferase involved in cell wall biosynthesis
VLLRAMRRVADTIPAVHLSIVGDGPQRAESQHIIDQLALGATVSLCPAVPHDQLAQLCRSADLYVQSSWHEAQGMAVLEAAACGTPLVGTAVGVIAELAPEAALSVPPGDEQALASAIASLLGDEERRRALGGAARTRMETAYSVDHCVERFVELYAGLR